jgi:putative ABC transport system ATP-binding protein
MVDTAITATKLTKWFGEGETRMTAVNNVEFVAHFGEMLFIVGPSGSGKTTLLSILGLVLTPTEGDIVVDGRSVSTATTDELAVLRRDRIGFIFQQFNLLPSLSALDNATVPLLLAGVPRGERTSRGMRALELVDMADKRAATPRLLSGGQQQRVAIARALVNGASVLLCDEPTASLDGKTGAAVLGKLRELAHDGQRAVVIVTHDERVLSIADRLVHVIDGSVQEDGWNSSRIEGVS